MRSPRCRISSSAAKPVCRSAFAGCQREGADLRTSPRAFDSRLPAAAVVVLAALSPAPSLASEAVSALRFLSSLKALPLAPRRARSVVWAAVAQASRHVDELHAQTASDAQAAVKADAMAAASAALSTTAAASLSLEDIEGGEVRGRAGERHDERIQADAKALADARLELQTLSALLALERRPAGLKQQQTAAYARRAVPRVRRTGLPTDALEAAFAQDDDDARDGAEPPAVLAPTRAHLLDLAAAASGGPPIRLPLPPPGQRLWVRGADWCAATTTAAAGGTEVGVHGGAGDGSPPVALQPAPGEEHVWLYGGGLADPHAVLAVSSDGLVQVCAVRKDASVPQRPSLPPLGSLPLPHASARSSAR